MKDDRMLMIGGSLQGRESLAKKFIRKEEDGGTRMLINVPSEIHSHAIFYHNYLFRSPSKQADLSHWLLGRHICLFSQSSVMGVSMYWIKFSKDRPWYLAALNQSALYEEEETAL